MIHPLLALSLQAAQLGVEAQQVIALRMLRLFGGDARAGREAERMITEKLMAATVTSMTAATALATGQSQTQVARRVIRSYRSKVRSNRRRLTRR